MSKRNQNPTGRKIRMTRATEARLKQGLSLKEAARQIGINPQYLRKFELHGGARFHRARQISRLYGCSIHDFI